MYYILDAQRMEALLSRYPDLDAVVKVFLYEAEALVAMKSYKDAMRNGPIMASRFVNAMEFDLCGADDNTFQN
jgi:hypothetical protein